MGEIYYEGVGVDKDYTQAAYWYQNGADDKHEASQKALAEMKAKGLIK